MKADWLWSFLIIANTLYLGYIVLGLVREWGINVRQILQDTQVVPKIYNRLNYRLVIDIILFKIIMSYNSVFQWKILIIYIFLF